MLLLVLFSCALAVRAQITSVSIQQQRPNPVGGNPSRPVKPSNSFPPGFDPNAAGPFPPQFSNQNIPNIPSKPNRPESSPNNLQGLPFGVNGGPSLPSNLGMQNLPQGSGPPVVPPPANSPNTPSNLKPNVDLFPNPQNSNLLVSEVPTTALSGPGNPFSFPGQPGSQLPGAAAQPRPSSQPTLDQSAPQTNIQPGGTPQPIFQQLIPQSGPSFVQQNSPFGPISQPALVPQFNLQPNTQNPPAGNPSSVAQSGPTQSIGTGGLAAATANFIHSLDLNQTVSFFQMMLLQQGFALAAPSRSGVAIVPAGNGDVANQPTLDLNVKVNGANTPSGSSSPLLQLTLFKGVEGTQMVQLVKDAGKSALGQYISSIHEYWKNAPSNLRDQYRLQLLRNIDSLNVSIKIKHAVQELLPGLIPGSAEMSAFLAAPPCVARR